MQQDIVGQVLGVSGRPTRTNKTIFDVAFSDGNKYTTFDGQLAQKANSLVGQNVSARIEVKQNGQYTNYNLLDIAPQGQLAPAAMPAPGGTPIIGASPIPMQPQSNNGSGGKKFTEADAVRITKLAALSTASTLVSALFQGAGPEALEEAVEKTKDLAKDLYEVARSHEQPSVQAVEQALAAVIPAEHTAEAVQAAVNEAAGTPVVQTGATIPW